jgi:glutathione S-transferase
LTHTFRDADAPQRVAWVGLEDRCDVVGGDFFREVPTAVAANRVLSVLCGHQWRYNVRMKLIGRYDSPYVRRVGVSLHALSLWFEHVPLSPFSQAAEFRKFAAIGRMPVLVLDSGETLIESAAILDYLDEVAGPTRALLPISGVERRKCLRILASSTAASDKAIAINYERRRPNHKIYADWIERSRVQLDAALSELEAFNLVLPDDLPLKQPQITAACTFGYVRRVDPDAVPRELYPSLDRLSAACEARAEFVACPEKYVAAPKVSS